MRKKGINLSNSYQIKGAGGNSAPLVITASNTAGTPIHQDDATPSVRLHQMSENRTPLEKMVDQLIFDFINVIRQHPEERTAQPRIHTRHPFQTHCTENLVHARHQTSD